MEWDEEEQHTGSRVDKKSLGFLGHCQTTLFWGELGGLELLLYVYTLLYSNVVHTLSISV